MRAVARATRQETPVATINTVHHEALIRRVEAAQARHRLKTKGANVFRFYRTILLVVAGFFGLFDST